MATNCTHPVMDGENHGDICNLCGEVITQHVLLAEYLRERESANIKKTRREIFNDFIYNFNHSKKIIHA